MRPKVASSRSFGLLMAAILTIVAGFVYWGGGAGYVSWLVAAVCFLVIAMAMPRLLLPLKRLWFKLGSLLHFVTNPVFLTVLYICAIAPVGFIMRLFGKDLLSLKADATAASYWIKRDPTELGPESLRKQF
jgi:hypothetical protein